MGNAVEDESSQDDEEQNRSSERSPIIFGAPWVGPPAVVAARRATPVFKAWVCHSRTAFTSPRNCRELFGERREEFHDVEERPLLLDHRINRDVLECDCCRHRDAFPILIKIQRNVSDVTGPRSVTAGIALSCPAPSFPKTFRSMKLSAQVLN